MTGTTHVRRTLAPMNKLVYDVWLWTFTILIDLFFREIHPRSSWKIPRKGPVLFVAAPHANQVKCRPHLMKRIHSLSQAHSLSIP